MNVIYELVPNYGDVKTNLPNTLNHFRQVNLKVWCEYFPCRQYLFSIHTHAKYNIISTASIIQIYEQATDKLIEI